MHLFLFIHNNLQHKHTQFFLFLKYSERSSQIYLCLSNQFISPYLSFQKFILFKDKKLASVQHNLFNLQF